jgi:hypothetical protein
MRIRAVTATAMTLLVGGCGAGYVEEFKNSSSITYWFDPARQSLGAVQARAQDHCDKYGKDAIINTQRGDAFSGISISFLCRKRD